MLNALSVHYSELCKSTYFFLCTEPKRVGLLNQGVQPGCIVQGKVLGQPAHELVFGHSGQGLNMVISKNKPAFFRSQPGWSLAIGTESPPLTIRSEEHTSELQSRPHLVCRLLLE